MGVITFCRDWPEDARRVFQRSVLLAPPCALLGLALGLAGGHQPLRLAGLLAPLGVTLGAVLNAGELVARQVRNASESSVVDAVATGGTLSAVGSLLYRSLAAPASAAGPGALGRLVLRTAAPAVGGGCLAHWYGDWALDNAEHRYVKAMVQQQRKVRYVVPYLQPRYAHYLRHGIPDYRFAPTSRDVRNGFLYYLGKVPGVMVYPEAAGWRLGYRMVDDPERPPAPPVHRVPPEEEVYDDLDDED